MRKLANSELERKSTEEFRSSEKLPIVVVLDNVRSAYNVGSVFRTADAFPVEAIYLCGITGYPPHKEILKTALGATETVKWKYNKSTLEVVSELKELGYKIYAIEQAEGSVPLNNLKLETLNFKFAVIFGHEVEGVQQDVLNACDGCIEIPQGGTKHSLNIAVSAGVVLWEFFRNWKAK
ncbi:MAG: RNA methyltransferase [Bacteroidetes bacterium]|nr:RNA methyltransferase [Bacteroidota bacterium]